MQVESLSAQLYCFGSISLTSSWGFRVLDWARAQAPGPCQNLSARAAPDDYLNKPYLDVVSQTLFPIHFCSQKSPSPKCQVCHQNARVFPQTCVFQIARLFAKRNYPNRSHSVSNAFWNMSRLRKKISDEARIEPSAIRIRPSGFVLLRDKYGRVHFEPPIQRRAGTKINIEI